MKLCINLWESIRKALLTMSHVCLATCFRAIAFASDVVISVLFPFIIRYFRYSDFIACARAQMCELFVANIKPIEKHQITMQFQ